ncbi:DNA alkylation repair protein [Fodinisporobacter ferrooxydans]|uniref:DNA alkylation repair protein n=1 Tax=Fodinisporobacter ferrooxydans TaxID=2901836 RepID=A0ABY4CLI7_9BACL|nr:DNA alkylation repair protein [Alicyclobacillaceae bacterium MYW30-H2]
MQPYACPSCRNKSRFYIMEQSPVSVKLHPQTGELVEYISAGDPLQQPYRGEMRRIQCAVCGVTDGAHVFAKTAERLK